MVLTANSNTVVDISGDNDISMAQAAVANMIPSNDADAFEKSCDNPECSAPKLISLVPKRDIPEFITEPSIMNQPTLINGFTTVFQIDGKGHKMDDIMNNSLGGGGIFNRPRSVFRVVPNTHAHIVNYVVVDSAGETMRKIKANEPETMRKLLDSQRLSAEQMLKKLIEKAFKVPSAAPPIPSAGPPVPSEVPTALPTLPTAVPLVPTAVPQVPTAVPLVPSAVPPSSAPVIPTQKQPTTVYKAQPFKKLMHPFFDASKVPSGITVTMTQVRKDNEETPSKKLPYRPAGYKDPKEVPPIKTNLALVPVYPKLPTKPASPETTKGKVLEVKPPKNNEPQEQQPLKLSLPPSVGVTVSPVQKPPKVILSPTAITTPTQKLIPKPIEELTNPIISPPSDTPRMAPRLSKINTSRPVIWQAVSPTNNQLQSKTPPSVDSSSQTDKNQKSPAKAKEESIQSSKIFESAMARGKPTTSGGLEATTTEDGKLGGNSGKEASQSLTPKQMDSFSRGYSTRLSTLNKPDPLSNTPMATRRTGQPTFLKRNRDEPQVPEAIKRLRPRSPKSERKVNSPHAANGQSPSASSPLPGKKMSTLPKQYTKIPTEPTHDSLLKKLTSISSASSTERGEVITSDPVQFSSLDPTKNADSPSVEENVTPSTQTTQKVEKTSTRTRPLMGPASKMRAIKALAAAKAAAQAAQAEKTEMSTRLKTSLASKTTQKIGDTIIKPIGSVNLKEAHPEDITQPCSVTVTDVVVARGNAKGFVPKTPKKQTTLQSTSKPATENKTEDLIPSKTQLFRAEPKTTRSSTPKMTATTKAPEKPYRRLSSHSVKSTGSESSGTALSLPSAPSRVLRVVLPSVKSPATTPVRSPHPNLKISSVISGGSAVAAATLGADTPPPRDESTSDIEQMQKELADLRRTVERLTKKKV